VSVAHSDSGSGKRSFADSIVGEYRQTSMIRQIHRRISRRRHRQGRRARFRKARPRRRPHPPAVPKSISINKTISNETIP
jgi:hypothetical protein